MELESVCFLQVLLTLVGRTFYAVVMDDAFSSVVVIGVLAVWHFAVANFGRVR